MRFVKFLPVCLVALALGLGACSKDDEADAELSPADTAMTMPPPAPDMMGDTMMMGDSMMMGDTTQM